MEGGEIAATADADCIAHRIWLSSNRAGMTIWTVLVAGNPVCDGHFNLEGTGMEDTVKKIVRTVGPAKFEGGFRGGFRRSGTAAGHKRRWPALLSQRGVEESLAALAEGGEHRGDRMPPIRKAAEAYATGTTSGLRKTVFEVKRAVPKAVSSGRLRTRIRSRNPSRCMMRPTWSGS